MSSAKSMPSVESLELPWAVAASVSNFRISVIENGGCQLELDSFWGNHCPHGQYRRILVEFLDVAAVYYGVFRNDHERGGRQPLDWPNVFVQPTSDNVLQQWLKSKAERWKATGIAPDPNFYRIAGSNWVGECGDQPNHFLVSGSDAFLEVLASRFDWSEVEMLES